MPMSETPQTISSPSASSLSSSTSVSSASPSKSRLKSAGSPPTSLENMVRVSSATQPHSMRKRYLVCITILISASLIIIVFLGPLFISSFPSLSDRADIFMHKEEKEKLLGFKGIGNSASQKYPQYKPVSNVKKHQQYKPDLNYAPAVERERGEMGESSAIPDPDANQAVSPRNPESTKHEEQENSILHLDDITQSAAEKLECPAHVVSFVVNATDVKDECDGLRKAFDETCGGTANKKKESDGFHNRMRRRLFGLDESAYGYYQEGDSLEESSVLSKALTWSPVRKYLGEKLSNLKEKSLLRLLQDDSQLNFNGQDPPPSSEEEEEKPKLLSPSLPTTNLEVGDGMATDALALNADLKDIAKVIEDIHNHTDSSKEHNLHNEGTGIHHVSQHHETSSVEEDEDLQSAAVAVSAMINSPKSIETQVCCKSILTVFHEECDTPEEEEFNDKRLFVIVCVIALCGLVKSLIRHFQLRWIPEAGGCIIVGMVGGMFLRFLPSMDFGFQHDMFLRLMVPPIVFEAALNIDKKSFSKMAVPIIIFAVWGTFMSTLLTAAIVYYGTSYFTMCTSIPFVESLAFGALISSIDPIAVLSVLNNMGMSDVDPIYVLIFGESLLNDGVAIVLFQTLVHFMDSQIVIDSEACWLATLHFLVIAFGSLFVGLTCGVAASLYFWLMKGIQTPLVEVSMFLCWAFIPYYICDGVDWSGIVAIVAAGFFMDIYVIGSKKEQMRPGSFDSSNSMLDNGNNSNVVQSRVRLGVFSQEGFLSTKAKNHIRFVTEINATLMETAIFAYLGIFLLNKRYHWSVLIALIGIVSCVASRSLTVVFSSFLSNMITKIGIVGQRRFRDSCASGPIATKSRPPTTEIDSRMQLVLIFAGLRGAMSFALVETVPMFDPTTGEGSRFKPELKAMTSSCIFFTIFVLGGYTYYLLDQMGMGPMAKSETDVEMVSLINGSSGEDEDDENPWAGGIHKRPNQRSPMA